LGPPSLSPASLNLLPSPRGFCSFLQGLLEGAAKALRLFTKLCRGLVKAALVS